MNRRRLLLALALVGFGALVLAPAAFAAGGGGTAGFGGGGEGGGGGGGGDAFAIYLIVRVLIQIALFGHGRGAIVLGVLAVLYALFRWVLPQVRAWVQARRRQGAAHHRAARRRERRVELAAAEAAEEDPVFDPDAVRSAAAELFGEIQAAWDAGDRARLRELLAPRLATIWEHRLDEFARQGWRNRSQPLAPPRVEYVGLRRGRGGPAGETSADRVLVRIDARIRDYVLDASGRHIRRRGSFTETVRLREVWTLERRAGRWLLASVEQGAEGSHALSDQIVPTAWSDEQALRDEALVEQAAAEAAPPEVSPAELVSLELTRDARAAALDLSLADGRFAPTVLEVAARRAVQAWMEAVDGSDSRLRALADPAATTELLSPGDPGGRRRLVVRGIELQKIEIVALDPAAQPTATMTVDVTLRGRRYIEDRDTTEVLAGDPARSRRFVQRWTLALSHDPQEPWRIIAASTPDAVAGTAQATVGSDAARAVGP